MNNTKYIQEDEIDLKELFLTLWGYKKFILVFTFFITTISLVYVFIFKPIPIYKGYLIVSLGQVKTEKGMIPISNMHNLKILLEAKEEVNENKSLLNIKVNIPKGTNGILKLVSKQYNKDLIKEKIEQSYLNLLEIEKEKKNFYKYSTQTKKVGFIHIEDKAINKPKKKLIVVVSFISAFILSIFLVFFIQFIRGFKEEKND